MLEYRSDEADDFDRLLAGKSTRKCIDLNAEPINDRELNRAFNNVITRLRRFYSIEKASLALYDASSEKLQVTRIKEQGMLKTGLTLNLSARHSIMYQVLKQGFPVADNFPEQISNSVIEKRILLGKGTKAVLIVPLIYESTRLGVLNLTSREPSAFGLFLEGVGEGIIAEFTASLYQSLLANLREVKV